MLSLRRIIESRPRIFGETIEEDEQEDGKDRQRTQSGELIDRYGWVVWFDQLSGGDYKKWPYFEKLKAEEILPIIQYHMVKIDEKNRQNELNRLKRR